MRLKEMLAQLHALLIMALMSFAISVCNGQHSKKIIIHTETCNHLIVGIDNYISIIAMQDSALTVEQISAFLITPSKYRSGKKPTQLEIEKKYGKFKINPDSLGVVEFQIQVNEKTEIKTIKVEPLQAVCRLANYKANSEAKISAAILKAQLGIIAYVECCGFDASCRVEKFEVIRVPINSIPTKAKNIGARFQDSTSNVINQAQPGDIYIFRNIYYQCPGSKTQRSEDLIIEIES